MTDFTVRVKNLPLKPAFDNLDELKAMLEMHIMQVIRDEPNVYQIRRDQEFSNVDEIVNIHFA